ncbi:MAG TPA: gamma-glutamyltransferase [Polyangiaceae bacterium]|nr:gamma-glutamyltransferase [Polyangiaceae bacterium]
MQPVTTGTKGEPTPIAFALHDGGPRSARSDRGMVVSVEANATQAGVEMLRQGGNAVDAAVAVGYALAVTHPSAGNIGGGGFMLVHLAGKSTQALDFRERAPKQLSQEQFDAMIQAGARGPAAAGVPGSVAGLVFALSKYGRLSPQVVMAPAIRLAREGHRIGKQQALALGWAWGTLQRDPEARRIFGHASTPKTKSPKKEGELLLQPELAATLERIVDQGSPGFYQGPTADAIVRSMGKVGLINYPDLIEYTPALRKPLAFPYRGLDVEVMPPSSAGGVAVASTLLMLEKLNPATVSPSTPESLHLLIEVARRTHTERRFGVMDPETTDYDDTARRARWLSPSSWFDAMPPIDPKKATPSRAVHPLYEAAVRELEHTTHFSVADSEGNVVSCTMTLSAGFGASFVVPGAGFVMNNSVAAFGTVGDSTPKPNRRTTSSMAPTLLLQHGQPIAVLGSPGGDTIPNTIVQVIRNLIDAQLPLEDAIDAPRIHHGFVPDEVRYESLFPLPAATQSALRALGHKLVARRVIGDANSIVRNPFLPKPITWGYADPREGGLALGDGAILETP